MKQLLSLKFITTLAFGLSALGSTSFGVASVDVDLSGLKLKHGLNQTANSGAVKLDPDQEYVYEISGTCKGTGRFQAAVPEGTPIKNVVNQFYSGQGASLTGSVFNVPGTHPYVALSKLYSGSKSFGFFTVAAKAKVEAKVDAAGTVIFSLTNVSFTVNGSPDTTDTIVFEPGAKCNIRVAEAPSAGPQPDGIVLTSAVKGLGNNIYNTTGDKQTRSVKVARGSSFTFTVLVQNDSILADTFLIKGSPSSPGFAVRYDIDNENNTSLVTGSGYQASLSSTQLIPVKVKVTVAPNANLSTIKTINVSAIRTTDSTSKDIVKLKVQGR